MSDYKRKPHDRSQLPEHFVRDYLACYRDRLTMAEAADRLGFKTRYSLQAKVGKFRAAGVKMPSLFDERQIIPERLNEIIQRELRKPTQATDSPIPNGAIEGTPTPVVSYPKATPTRDKGDTT